LERQGARFSPGKGSHLHVEFNGRHSVFPFHGAKEIPAPLVSAIKKDLGLK
jgi:mRNA interferase HicA